MKTVVITGSTRGIGRGLAENFLKRGCQVVVSGRGQQAVDALVAELAGEHGVDKVSGCACDVTRHESLQALWDHSVERFERILAEEVEFIKRGEDQDTKRVQIRWEGEAARWYPVAVDCLRRLVLESSPVEFVPELILPFTFKAMRDYGACHK